MAAATAHSSGSTPSRTLSTFNASGCTQPVGGTSRRWLAGEVLELAPQYCRPGGPATANHLIHHAVLNKMSRRLGASGARKDGELFPRSIADNGSSWRRGAAFALHRRQRVLMETAAGSFAHHFAVSTSVDNCQRPPRAVARYVSAVEPGKVLNAEKCLEAISRRI